MGLNNVTNNISCSEVLYWKEYQVEDGTILKVKLVLRGVKRLDHYEPDFTPIYAIYNMNFVRAVNIPPELKVKPKKPEMNPV